jgi:hypothetical protein
MSGIEPAFILLTRQVLNHLASSALSVVTSIQVPDFSGHRVLV